MTLKETVSYRTMQLCAEQKISPNALAVLCGIDRSTVYRILGDEKRSPEIATVKKICDGLEITLGVFFSTPEFERLEQEIK